MVYLIKQIRRIYLPSSYTVCFFIITIILFSGSCSYYKRQGNIQQDKNTQQDEMHFVTVLHTNYFFNSNKAINSFCGQEVPGIPQTYLGNKFNRKLCLYFHKTILFQRYHNILLANLTHQPEYLHGICFYYRAFGTNSQPF